MRGTDSLYYRLGLAKAKEGNLTEAIYYARISLEFNPENEGAKKLLEICLKELIGTSSSKMPQDDINRPLDALELLRCIKHHIEGKNAVARVLTRLRARSYISDISEDSLRALNIKACAFALIGDYKKAAKFFAKALERDQGNTLAARGLRQVCERLWSR